MKRRNFLKFLGLTAIAPKVAVDVLSSIKQAPKKIIAKVKGYWVEEVTPLRGEGVSGENTLTVHEETLSFKMRYVADIEEE